MNLNLPITLTFIYLILPTISIADGGLSASPRRIEFINNQRTDTLTLTNSGDQTTQYRIKLVDYIYVDGKLTIQDYKNLPKDYLSAKKLIRYSPRQVTIKPNKSQTIRLLARRTRNLPTGEYRSFILFKAIPNKQQAKNSIQNLANLNKRKKFKSAPIISQSLALPVIVRQGKLSASAKSISLTLEHYKNKQPYIKFHLSRSGNRSLYGEIIAEQDGETVGIAKGLTLYTPYKEQTFNVALDSKKLKSGKLTVTYQGLDHDSGTIFATGEIMVP